MASSKLSKVGDVSMGEEDILTNLPDGVKGKILAFLPIKEAGRTSILSSKWRHTWAFVPELTFPDINTDSLYPSESVEFVDTILLLHRGSIRKCFLCIGGERYDPFDRWIVNLSRNGIRELTLEFCPWPYDMHPRFFSCYELNYIDLVNCSLRLPLHFKGFKLLHTLALTRLTVSRNDFEKLISSCPLLKKLRLVDLLEPLTLNIRAPNLLNLEIESCDLRDLQVCTPNLLKLEIRYSDFEDLQVCAPRLHSLYVWKRLFRDKHNKNKNKVQRVLGNMPDLGSFELKGYFLEYFCDDLPEKFPLTFNRLTNLVLELDFGAEKEAAFVLALFHGCPHLQLLNINVYLASQLTEPTAKIWEMEDRREDLFKHLKRVDIVDFEVADSVLSFVQFILGSAPQLVSLNIEENQKEKKDERMMFEQILKFERASPKAKIIFK